MLARGLVVTSRKAAVYWHRRYHEPWYSRLLSAAVTLPKQCDEPMRAINDRIKELWEIVKDDPDNVDYLE